MYQHVKAICLFCDASIEGWERFMTMGKRFDSKGGHPEKWLKQKPEYKWAWNGLTERINNIDYHAGFYLCPNHQTDKDFKEAFQWCKDVAKRHAQETTKA